jgi:hypothetical protein
MSWATRIIDGVANTYNYANIKFRTPDIAPRYIGAEVMGEHKMPIGSSWGDMSYKQRQRIAMTTSWIYSNIIRIGNEVSSAQFHVKNAETLTKDIKHPFEKIMRYPNPFFDGTTLLKYTIWALSLDQWGAYWFLSPNRETGELEEVWPIPIGKITPVKHKTKYIDHWLYTSSKGVRVRIRPEYMVRFMYVNPFDLWKSLTPLEASTLVLDVYDGITTAQRDLYSQSRGMPLSILSLDQNISDPDFARARQVIRDDWEEQRRVAIVRAGTMDIESVGFSNTDLQVIQSQEFTRDEIDAIYMGGIQWRKSTTSGEREEINKEIKEVVIHPLHQMIAAQIQLGIVTPWYGEDFIGVFDDIRAQDRSLSLQENTIYFRSMTVNETRGELGLDPMDVDFTVGMEEKNEMGEKEETPERVEYGELPYSLANNPSFITSYYGFGKGSVRDPGKKPEEIGNLEDSRDQEAIVEELSGTDTPEPENTKSISVPDGTEQAIAEGIKEELKRYRKVMRRTFKQSNNPMDLLNRPFDSEIIPWETRETIQRAMAFVESDEDIMAIFSKFI